MKKSIGDKYMRLSKKMLYVVVLVFTFFLINIALNFEYRFVIVSYDITIDTEESEINDYIQKLKSAQKHLADNGINSQVEKTDNAVLLKIKKNILTQNDLVVEKLLIANTLVSN